MKTFLRDVRFAFRTLARSPGFTAAAVATLALGIGATTAILSLCDAALFRGLPYRQSDRLVHLWETNDHLSRGQMSYPDYVALAEGARGYSQIAGYSAGEATLAQREGSRRVRTARITAGFLATLGVPVEAGRDFRPTDEAPGQGCVAILSHSLSSRLFGSAGAADSSDSRVITLDQGPCSVVGVLPAAFHFAPVGDAGIWLPIRPTVEQRTRSYYHWLRLVARIAPGVSPEAAQGSAQAVAFHVAAKEPRWHAGVRFVARPLRDEIVGDIRPILSALAAAVVCVLLIACVNVANLLIGRSIRRRREISIRVALGATRAGIARFLLAESLLLSAIGALGGLAVAQGALGLLLGAIPAQRRAVMPFLSNVGLSAPVLAATAAVTVAAALLFGLAPAITLARTSPLAGLKGSSLAGGGRPGRQASFLVAGEIALTLVLLAGTALLARSTAHLLSADLGYDASRLLTMQIWLPSNRFRDRDSIPPFERRLLDEVAALPGVESAASVDALPIGGGGTGTPLDGRRPLLPDANLRTVSPSYFATMRIPVRAGRPFASSDDLASERVVLVNQTFAAKAYPAADAVGRRIAFEFLSGPPLTIVGVVGDENVSGPAAPVTPVVYFPSAQDPSASFSLVLSTRRDPESLGGAVAQKISALDRDAVASGVSSLSRRLSDSPAVFLRRFPAGLFGAFATAGLLLAAVGIFGVAGREVSRRTREIGIRMALGAAPADIVRVVAATQALPIALGIAAGLCGSLAAARLMRGMLFGISLSDTPALIMAAMLLAAVALGASLLPAARAARTDAARALRSE